MSRSAAIVLPIGDDAWRIANLTLGFRRVAEQLATAGFSVRLLAPAGHVGGLATEGLGGAVVTPLDIDGEPPTIASGVGGSATASLRIGRQIWRRLVATPPDVVLAPLLGGVLQPTLMSRAIGESLCETATVLWGEAGAAERLQLGDIEPASLAEVVGDALEKTVSALVDAVAAPRSAGLTEVGDRLRAPLLLPAVAGLPSTRPQGGRIDEIVFVGPASGRHGAPAFFSAIEQLDSRGMLSGRRVTFLGPWREGAVGVGRAMLGRRARDWSFQFSQTDETNLDRLLTRLRRQGVLAVFPGQAADDDVLAADAARTGVRLAICTHHPLATHLRGVAHVCSPDLADLGGLLDQGAAPEGEPPPTPDWPGFLESVIEKRQARRPAPVVGRKTAGLCITHRDRPAALTAAIASAGATGAKTVVADTGSRTRGALEGLDRLEREGHRVIRLAAGTHHHAARNIAAEESDDEILVFLDDDNVFIDDGLSRLTAAFAADVDIVVTTLTIYDGPAGQGPPVANQVFMGDAGWAGLLFNGFGDGNFAIRRDSFRRLGGFAQGDMAAPDWIFLANAHARGLKFGVLQQPAIGYSRDLGAIDTKWRKLDLEGPRRLVLQAYSEKVPPLAILALLQKLALPLVH